MDQTITNTSQVHENEVLRCFKTVNDAFIEPISFIVPRRAEVFQSDIYPPTTGIKPAASSAEWFNGKTGLPPKISLESIYEGTEPAEIPSDYKPSSSAPPISPPATKTETEPPKPAPAPVPVAVQRNPPPSMKENKASIASMAFKFADKEEEESSESSFEEIPKPAERPAAIAARMEEKTQGPEIARAPDAKSTAPLEAPKPTVSAQVNPAALKAAPTSVKDTPTPTPGSTPSGAAEGIKGYLTDIKSMLEQQSLTMTNQLDQIMHLTQEVNTLKAKMGEHRSTREKDERIRQLELELEEARS